MNVYDWFAVALIILCSVASVISGKLTILGGITGGVFALAMLYGSGITGILMLGTFFLLGTIATGWKKHHKEILGFAEKDKGKRKASQVWANGGIAAVLAGVSIMFPDYNDLLHLMIASCFSSASADTLSSELGMIYGRKHYNVLSFRKDIRGENGVISLEGTLAGIAASAIIAGIGFIWSDWQWSYFLIVIVAGLIGNLTDSLLGATLEQKGIIGNDLVNLLNTLAGAFSAGCLYLLL